jgi:hypothetical protein
MDWNPDTENGDTKRQKNKKKRPPRADERDQQQLREPDQGVPRRPGWPHEKTNRTR